LIKLKPKANWREIRMPGPMVSARWYMWGDLRVCVGDPVAEGHWHISISHPYRYPTWDEIYTARYDFCPHDINMAIILPKKSEYVNIHPNCFHVHELRDEELPKELIL
jgi:hypothetical protein